MEIVMPAKKESSRKSTAKKVVATARKTKKPDLQEFLDRVEKRAYELYQERMITGTPGDDISDWFRAEKEMKVIYKL
jgi:lipoate-protein ligase A